MYPVTTKENASIVNALVTTFPNLLERYNFMLKCTEWELALKKLPFRKVSPDFYTLGSALFFAVTVSNATFINTVGCQTGLLKKVYHKVQKEVEKYNLYEADYAKQIKVSIVPDASGLLILRMNMGKPDRDIIKAALKNILVDGGSSTEIKCRFQDYTFSINLKDEDSYLVE